MIFFPFLFLKTFHIQILNLSSGREVFKTSNQRDGFSSVCESDLWRWILSLFRFLVHTTNVFHLYVQYYLNQKESSTGTFPIAFSCWDGDVSFTPTTGNIFKNQIVNNHSTSQNHFYNSKQSTFSALFPWIRRWCRLLNWKTHFKSWTRKNVIDLNKNRLLRANTSLNYNR